MGAIFRGKFNAFMFGLALLWGDFPIQRTSRDSVTMRQIQCIFVLESF